MGAFLLISQVVVAVGACLELLLSRRRRTPGNVARAILSWSLPVNVGVAGVWAFLGHWFKSDEVARSIGWPTGNPFQKEVAGANLAFGVLGLLCIPFRGAMWWAAAIGQGIFLWSAAATHTREIREQQNFNPGNAGAIYYWDILAPLAHLALLVIASRSKDDE